MTDEQIISLVKEYFEEEWCEEDGNGWVEFAGKPDAFLKFARLMYEEGFGAGFNDGYDQGLDDVNNNPIKEFSMKMGESLIKD